jgi:hypothetical protein
MSAQVPLSRNLRGLTGETTISPFDIESAVAAASIIHAWDYHALGESATFNHALRAPIQLHNSPASNQGRLHVVATGVHNIGLISFGPLWVTKLWHLLEDVVVTVAHEACRGGKIDWSQVWRGHVGC